jgi:hypothetical protein
MGKGFNIQPRPGQPVPPRGDAGRFVPPAPPQVVDDARSTGAGVIAQVQKVQAPEHSTPGGKNHVAEEIPPIKATPPPKPPMRLTSGQ